jgi:hypothetical protein
MKALRLVLLGSVLLASTGFAEEGLFGAVAPARLPAGATSLYGFVGAPEIGAGFRQGLGPFELGAEASLNYLDLSFAGLARLKFLAVDDPRWQLAPFGGLGFAWDSGSTYYDKDNFRPTAVRLDVGAVATYPVRETLSLLATTELTWDLFTSPLKGYRAQPLVGAGAELALGGNLSAFALAAIGVDLRKLPSEWVDAEVGYSLRFGFAVRMF